MMPFSPLRIWGAGFLSWAILLGGCYCIWKWSRDHSARVHSSPPASVPIPGEATAEAELDSVPAQQEFTRRTGDYWLLGLGIGLITWSTVGCLPITLLLGKPGPGVTKARPSLENKIIKRADGTELYVEIHGRREGPMLLFTHGWSLDSTVWKLVLDNLAKRFRIVVWDLPGLGRSKGPQNGDFRLEKMADDLAAVVHQLGKEPVILVGHSIGGMIIQTFCRLYPKQLGTRVAGLVLLHTTYVNPLRTALFASLWTIIEKPILIPLNYLTIWLAPLASLSNWQSYFNGSLHIVTRLASFSGRQSWSQLNYGAWLAAKAWPAVIARGNLAMLTFNEELTLSDIEIPVLVIAAKHDRMTKPSASQRIEALLPHAVLASVASGHLGFWEQPAEIAGLIGEFAERFEMEGNADMRSIARPFAEKSSSEERDLN